MRLPCIILAGGLATRMHPMTRVLPKTLLRVGGVCFADLQLGWLRSQGVARVIYGTGHLGQMVRDHVGDGAQFGLRVEYVEDGPAPLGTAGALRHIIDEDLVDAGFFVLNGDSFLNVDVAAVEKAFLASTFPALMTVFRNRDRWVPSNAVLGDGRVVLYDKRSESHIPEMQWIDYGLLALHPEVVLEAVQPGEAADLADVMRALSLRGRLGGFEANERFFEIGTPSGLLELEKHLRDRASDGGHEREEGPE